jgi:NitT/TauT family transport system permease protein
VSETGSLPADRAAAVGTEAASYGAAVAREQARQRTSIRLALESYVYPTLTFVLLLAGWQIATVVGEIPTYLLPGPIAIVEEMINRADILWKHGLVTLGEVVAGFALSVAVGIPLAVLISYSRVFERTIYPLLVSSQTIPKVAIAPLFIVWFGFGIMPKILITFLIAFFPIVIDTVVGLRSTPQEMFYLVRSMGASPWQTFWKVRLPNALPSIFGGLKVAITLAVVGAIVGEFVGADQGLGYLIQIANGNLDTRLLMGSIVVLALIGIVLFLIIEWIERLVSRGPIRAGTEH